MRGTLSAAFLGPIALLAACSAPPAGPDGAALDAAIADAPARADAARSDVTITDSAGADVLTTDGAVDDAAAQPDGAADDGAAGPAIALAIACDDAPNAVYDTPPGLPPMTPELRGVVVHCARDGSFDQAAVQQQLTDANVAGVTATTGVEIYRIAYRTMRDATRGGLTSARVYVPRSPVAAPRPFVLLGHPTDGLADSCASSRSPTSGRNIALPFAAVGYVTIVPDLAGFGTEGTQAYTDQADTGRSMLDGSRALRRMLAPDALGRKVVLAGYSQGGGAVFAAQALADTYGLDGDIVASVPFAAEWRTRMNSFQLVSALSNPSRATALIDGSGTVGVVTTYTAYGWFENFVGAGRGDEAFPASKRAGVVAAINSQCLVAYGGYVQTHLFTVNDWLDDTFRTQFLACNTALSDPGCTGNGRGFFEHLQADTLPPQPTWAPVLYVQGSLDQIMPPAREGSCNIAALRAAGTDVTVCADNGATHGSVTERNMARALAWVAARLAGTPPPACPAGILPPCQP